MGEWRPIPGHRWYEVSDQGQVRSIDRRISDGRFFRGKLLKQCGSRYLHVSLNDAERGIVCMSADVHVLVCRAFNGEKPSPELEVCHKNGESFDNRAANLEWGPPEQNNGPDKRRHGRALDGERNHKAKLSAGQVREIRARQGESREKLAAEYGVGRNAIWLIISGRSWKEV